MTAAEGIPGPALGESSPPEAGRRIVGNDKRYTAVLGLAGEFDRQ
jgi:hypothetical protein